MILINGQQNTYLDSQDRGLHYGHGLFTTIAVIQGQPELWDLHCQRLVQGAARLKLGFLPADCACLLQEVLQVSAGLPKAVVKIIITAGVSERGYAYKKTVPVTRLIAAYPWPAAWVKSPMSGIVTRICQQRLSRQPALAGIKHLNRLEQILARAEWEDPTIEEGIMLDTQDWVIEGISSNLFIVQNGMVLTPDLSQCGVAGVMRQWLLQQLQTHTLPFKIVPVTLHELANAEEVWLCNSIRQVIPVKQCGEWNYQPGKITRSVMAWVADGLQRERLTDGNG